MSFYDNFAIFLTESSNHFFNLILICYYISLHVQSATSLSE